MNSFWFIIACGFVSSLSLAKVKDPTLLYSQQLPLSGGSIQSRFVGPVDLRVWKHEQASWNIEDKTSTFQFELVRGFNRNNEPFVTLRYRSEDPTLLAELWGMAVERSGEDDVTHFHIPRFRNAGVLNQGWAEFTFENAEDFLDMDDTRVVTSISFRILSHRSPTFGYNLYPMHVRGDKSGIHQMTTLHSADGFGMWNSVQVAPRAAYIQTHEFSLGSSIELHRHEKNQESWRIRSGRFLAVHVVSQRSSDTYRTERIWGSQNTRKATDEFAARGGWIESRVLEAGDIMTLAPNPNYTDTVYGHGIKALCKGVFVSTGDRN